MKILKPRVCNYIRVVDKMNVTYITIGWETGDGFLLQARRESGSWVFIEMIEFEDARNADMKGVAWTANAIKNKLIGIMESAMSTTPKTHMRRLQWVTERCQEFIRSW